MGKLATFSVGGKPPFSVYLSDHFLKFVTSIHIHPSEMETAVESNGAEKAKGVAPVQVEAVKEVKQEEVETERSKVASSGKSTTPAKSVPAKTAPSRRSREGERARSRDRQSERERQRRGERSRGGDSKGSGYKPRTRPECRVKRRKVLKGCSNSMLFGSSIRTLTSRETGVVV